MTPTETLMREHRVIERVLGCLEKLADNVQAGEGVDVASGRDAIRFLRVYADACHHGKEELRLFPAMERFGVPGHVGPTAVMREEHVLGRNAIERMDRALGAADRGGAGAAAEFAGAARDYVLLLVEHIAKEDQVLFPLAAGILPPDEQQSLQAEFDRFDRDEVGDTERKDLESLVDRLCERLGVEGPPSSSGRGGCGSCHGH